MRRFSVAGSLSLVFLGLSFLGIAIEGAGDEKSMGQAQVSSDTQKVFAEASSSSSIVYLLKRGDAVSITLRISTSGDDWCRVVLRGHAGPLGYVPCKSLTSASSVAQVSASVTSSASAVAPHAELPAVTGPNIARPISNNDISEMAGAGLPPEVLIAKIKSSACDFDTSPAALKNLKAAGVSDKVILAMIEAPVGLPRPSPPVTAPDPATSSPSPSVPSPSDGRTRVLVTDSQSWEARGYSAAGGNRNGWGASSSYSGGARPQTAEIIKTLNERCPQIIVTNRLDKADFVITLDHEGGKALLTHHNKIAVFNKDGDVIFSKSTISLGNSVKDACQVMSGAKK
jgi:hypothetical protein